MCEWFLNVDHRLGYDHNAGFCSNTKLIHRDINEYHSRHCVIAELESEEGAPPVQPRGTKESQFRSPSSIGKSDI
jgi:hypothetical protein